MDLVGHHCSQHQVGNSATQCTTQGEKVHNCHIILRFESFQPGGEPVHRLGEPLSSIEQFNQLRFKYDARPFVMPVADSSRMQVSGDVPPSLHN
eukprot:2384852-Pyramimonas_sp.AAC.3